MYKPKLRPCMAIIIIWLFCKEPYISARPCHFYPMLPGATGGNSFILIGI